MKKLNDIIICARPRQWIKNVLVLAPVVFEKVTDPIILIKFAGAFVLFCFAASATYLLNDILDRDRDREHPLKQNRPIAAGRISVATALCVSVLMGIGALILSYNLGIFFGVFVSAYILLHLLYSLFAKMVIVLDVIIIAIGFVIRVEAGGAIVDVPSTPWIILTTFFLALFLGLAKRRAELLSLGDTAAEHREVLGQYTVEMLDRFLITAGGCAVISYAMFAVSTHAVEKFQTTNLVYTVPFVLFCLFRFYYLTTLNERSDNPTDLILGDWPFLAGMLSWLLSVIVILHTAS